MTSSSLIKVVAAFVTGVLVALVGALAYVKVADRSPSEPVIKTPVVEKVAGVQRPSQPAPVEPVSVESASVEPANKDGARAKRVRRATLSPVGHKFVHRSPAETVAQVSPITEPLPPNPYSTEQQPAAVPEPQTPPASAAAPAVQAPVREAQSVTLEPGTNLVMRLNDALSTEHNYTGDAFRGTLDAPVIVNGFIIADKGSKVLGQIVNVQKPGRVQGQADLALTLTEINTTDGQRVAIQTSSFDKKGGSSTGRDAAKVAGGAALGAIIGAIAGGGKGAGIGAGVGGAAGAGDVLLTRGKAAAIPNETVLTFRLSAPVTITERLN